VVKLDENDLQSDLMNSAFPSLSKLLNIDEKVLMRLLVSLDLVRKKKINSVFHYIPTRDKWVMFFGMHKLDCECSNASIGGKRRTFYIRIGLRNTKSHPPVTINFIWAKAKQDIYPVPRWRVSSSSTLLLAMEISRYLSQQNAETINFEESDLASVGSIDSSDEEASNGSDSNELLEAAIGEEEQEFIQSGNELSIDGSDEAADSSEFAQKYPLLHKFNIPIRNEQVMNGVINEIVNLFGGESVQYRHPVNQRKALLVKIPQVTSHRYFKKLFTGRRGRDCNALETILSFLCKGEAARNERTPTATAAYWICHYLFERYEDQFLSVAVEKGITDTRKPTAMSVPQTIAVFHDANINTKNSRVISRHIEQF